MSCPNRIITQHGNIKVNEVISARTALGSITAVWAVKVKQCTDFATGLTNQLQRTSASRATNVEYFVALKDLPLSAVCCFVSS